MPTGLKGMDRLPRQSVRERRNATRLAKDFISLLGDGLDITGAGVISIDYGTGLQIVAGALTTKDSEIDHDSLSNYAVGQHRIINDAGTAADELWSASKIDTDLGGKVATSRQIISGTGISGGGDLTADRTLNLDAAVAGTIGGVKEATARADSTQNAVTLTSVTMPLDAPADADALRDDLVANALAELSTRDGELETAIETLAGEFNDLLSKLRSAGSLAT